MRNIYPPPNKIIKKSMKEYIMNNYKGKYFMLCDKIDEDDYMGFEIGRMREDEITDEFLKEHVDACIYYGIPAYYGKDKKLAKRIERLYKEYDEKHPD